MAIKKSLSVCPAKTPGIVNTVSSSHFTQENSQHSVTSRLNDPSRAGHHPKHILLQIESNAADTPPVCFYLLCLFLVVYFPRVESDPINPLKTNLTGSMFGTLMADRLPVVHSSSCLSWHRLTFQILQTISSFLSADESLSLSLVGGLASMARSETVS